MRTTIDLPDGLLRQAKARAALDGTTLGDLVTRCIEQGLRLAEDDAERRRSELPVAHAPTGKALPALDNADLHRILDQEEVECGRAN